MNGINGEDGDVKGLDKVERVKMEGCGIKG